MACGRLHPNATSDALRACTAGVLMDMTGGCTTCIRATDQNISHCMLPFEDIKCTPCDVNILRHLNECQRSELGDLCATDNMLHLSDQCAACLVLKGDDDPLSGCMPDPSPGQCLVEDWPGVDALTGCPDDDEACSGAAMDMLSDVRLSSFAVRSERSHIHRAKAS